MKKLFLNLCAVVLLVSSVCFVIGSEEKAEAAVDDKIFATPVQAKKIGPSFTTTAKATRAELNDLSDILDYDNTVQSIHNGIIATVITLPLKPKLAVSIGTGGAVLSAYAGSTKSKIVTDALKKSSKSTFNVKVTYTYRQVGSGAGYYEISKIAIN